MYKQGIKLATDLYTKPTDKNNVLHYQTNHPKKMVDSLPWSQLLCVRKIVSDNDRVDSRLDEMCEKFIKRGYPAKLVNGNKSEALTMEKDELLNPARNDKLKT